MAFVTGCLPADCHKLDICWHLYFSICVQIGEAFFSKSAEAATEHLEKRQAEIDEEIEALNLKTEELKGILSDLKVKLYAKFGNNINLENEEEWLSP